MVEMERGTVREAAERAANRDVRARVAGLSDQLTAWMEV